MSEKPKLVAKALTKNYGGTTVLDNVDFEVRPGEVVAVLGPSGSGKSTFLRLLSLLEPSTRGQIYLDGAPIGSTEDAHVSESKLAKQRTDMGMVFQTFNLFPHLTVLQNLTLGPRVVFGIRYTHAVEQADALLKRVGLLDQREKYPSELSGGQQQRVAIARALILSPKVMLFDEPTSALDPELVQEVLSVMEDLASGGMTMIVVTHEVGFARNVADRVALFDSGQIMEQTTPDVFFSETAHTRTQRFLRHVL